MDYNKKCDKYKNKSLQLKHIVQRGGSSGDDENKNIEIIGISNLINIILVNEGLRPAMLIQPWDNSENSGKDPITKSILDAVKIEFPELIHSENYNIYQGILISKSNFNNREDITLEKMGEILGYPCYKDFITTDWIKNNISYGITIIAKLEDGRIIEIFSNICKDMSITKFNKFVEDANKIKIFQEKYKSFLGNITFEVKIRKTIPNNIIINKILSEEILDEDDKNKIINELGDKHEFNDEMIKQFEEYIQYDNQIHKGIILQLLVDSLYDSLSPFYPIQNYEGKLEQVNSILQKRGNEIINILLCSHK
jgi:hypothetical protein